MRHHRAPRKFGRRTNQRRALLRSLAEGLIKRGRIITTEARAKELKSFAEKLITLARKNSLASRRLLVSRLGKAAAAERLFKTVAPKYKERPGGYTRLVKLPPRRGDASPRALIELI